MTFTITRHSWMPGVGLAIAGHWGGQRHADDDAAVAAAHAEARGKPHSIERETISRRR